jgi:hypothetical protein
MLPCSLPLHDPQNALVQGRCAIPAVAPQAAVMITECSWKKVCYPCAAMQARCCDSQNALVQGRVCYPHAACCMIHRMLWWKKVVLSLRCHASSRCCDPQCLVRKGVLSRAVMQARCCHDHTECSGGKEGVHPLAASTRLL